MRNRFLSLAAVLCGVVVSLIAFAGCDQDFAPQDVKSAVSKGIVRVLIEDGLSARADGRTAFPMNHDFIYALTFTAEGKSDVTVTLNGNAGDIPLESGVWTLNVIGKSDGETVAEADPVTVAVPAKGDAVSVSVTMYPTLNGANGTFSYLIAASGGLSGVSAVLTPIEVGTAEQDAADLYIGYERTASVAPGYYRLKVTALKGTQTLIRWEVVHIYSRTTTEKTYTLSEADFAPAVYLAGTLTGGIEGYRPTEVIAYEDAECRAAIGQGTVSGGAWNVEAEGVRETLYFKVKLVKDGVGAYYSKPVSENGVPVAGMTDIVLSIEGYTVTFDANGGVFEGGGTSVSLTAPENGTLTPPSVSHSEYTFTGWYITGGKSFTVETRITGDITVYAGWLIGLDDIADYLANAQGGETADTAYQLTLNTDIGNGGWESILSTVDAADKYVALDLSGATMNGTEFDPGTGNAGAAKVVELILPDAAKSIKAGSYNNATFKDFTALGSLSSAGVEMVGEYAFSNCRALTSVSLPAATSIGNLAFYQCAALESVSLPAAASIGESAFYNCTALESVSLPASLTTIASSAFNGCTNLTSLTIDSANPAFSARDGMLLDKAETTLIAFPSATGSVTLTVTSISEYAFRGCSALEAVSLPVATSIGSYAFRGCPALESVSLPAATSIGSNAFYQCAALESVNLPAATSIGSVAFYQCAALESVNLPAATSIGSVAFASCRALESVSLPAVRNIGGYAFSSCSALEAVSLPVATSIGSYAFYQCAALESVSLPAATSIGSNAFYQCAALKSVDMPLVQTIQGSSYSGDGAFRNCTSLESVSLPVATSIGEKAFSGCTALASVSLPVVASIGGDAFYYCTALESVSLPVATSIGGDAFEDCYALESVSLPAATSIGSYAFYGCTSLESVSLPAATSIGVYAFYNCTRLTSVSLPAATDIGSGAFYICDNLTSVSLPATPPSIGSTIFLNANTFPGTITITVPAGAVPAYTSAWGVDAETPAGGNTSVYGSGHKAVLISE